MRKNKHKIKFIKKAILKIVCLRLIGFVNEVVLLKNTGQKMTVEKSQ